MQFSVTFRHMDATDALKVGDVRDLSNFTSAVIDERAFSKHVEAIERARNSARLVLVLLVDQPHLVGAARAVAI